MASLRSFIKKEVHHVRNYWNWWKTIKSATVTAKVEKQGKEKKVVIFKYNPKKHYHKKQGHRQPYTKLVIEDIKKTARKAAAKKTEEATAE